MWTYKIDEHLIAPVESLQDIPEGAIGFVYIIRHNEDEYARDRSTDSWYIGKKSLYSHRTLPPLKGQKRKRKIVKESDWINYQSSNKEVQQWPTQWKQILQYAYSKKELTYLETKYLFQYNALEDKNSFNGNILAKFYKGEFDKQ